MASPISVPVGLSASQLWSGRNTSAINTLLLINTDVNNTAMVGSSLQSIVVPIPPNGSLSVDPVENWYVQGTIAGQSPVVVVPNGQSTFRGLSQGAGKLALPQFQSPGFVSGSAGWAVFENGHAEFNDIVIRGGEVVGGQQFLYSSFPPVANNLIYSNSITQGQDSAGNWYLPGTVNYGQDVIDGTGYIAVQVLEGIVSFYFATVMTGVISPWSKKANLLWSAVTGMLVQASGGIQLELQGFPVNLSGAVTDIFAVKPGTTSTEDDFTYPALQNGWVNNPAFGRFGYRKVSSPPASVELTGAISGTAATAAQFATLPTGYIPATPGGRPCNTNSGNAGATTVAGIRWDASGNLAVANNAALPVAASFLFGFTIPLTAT